MHPISETQYLFDVAFLILLPAECLAMRMVPWCLSDRNSEHEAELPRCMCTIACGHKSFS